MTYDQFQAKYLGKPIDYDGTAGVQCVDLADQYLKDVFGITGIWVNGARDFYNNFESYPALVKNFNRIPNTRDLIIKKGDIVVWNGGTWGHIAVGDGKGNIDWFESLEQNTLGKHEPTQLVVHYYNNNSGVDGCWPVLGVLRAKDQSKVLGKQTKSNTKMVTDFSEAQYGVNYSKLAGLVDGVIIRVGYRGYQTGRIVKDVRFDEHIKGVSSNKIPYGFYFFSQAITTAEAIEEADYVYSQIKKYKPSYPIYIDVEDANSSLSGRGDKMTAQQRTDVVVAFCERIKAHNLIPGIYSGEGWFTIKMQYDRIAKYTRWIAKYGTNNGKPQNKPTLDCDGWQYTSHYPLSAVSNGDVDMSYFYKSFETRTPKDIPVEYKTYYANDKNGVNYRKTPNGTYVGTYKYGEAVQVVVGSDTNQDGLVWVKAKNGYWSAKNLLSVTKPVTNNYPYQSGKTYTLQTDMKVRSGASTNDPQIKTTALLSDDKKNAYNQTYAVLKKGTKVILRGVIKRGDKEYWGKIASGYICLMSGTTKYAK